MDLYITEKPDSGKSLAKALGNPVKKQRTHWEIDNGDVVTWCVGHLLEDAKPDAYGWTRDDDPPFIPMEWKKEPVKDKKVQLDTIGKFLKKAETVYHGGDGDREGQIIVDEVLEYFGNTRPVYRLWTSAQTVTGWTKALKKASSNSRYFGTHAAAVGRSRADWLVGMNLSKVYTRVARAMGYGNLAVGRVMVPATTIVVRRAQAIETFVPVEHYKVLAEVTGHNGTARMTWKPEDDDPDLNGEGLYTSKMGAETAASRIAADKAVIARADTERKSDPAPLPLTLSRLKTEAFRCFKLDGETTLEIAQELYQTDKATTYPRADGECYEEDEFERAGEVLDVVASVLSLDDLPVDRTVRSRAWNDKKLEKANHAALAPTGEGVSSFSQWSEAKQGVFTLICAYYVAQFMPNAEDDKTQLEALTDSGDRLAANGSVEVDPGWRSLFRDWGLNRNSDRTPLPSFTVDEAVSIDNAWHEQRYTKPPKPFSKTDLENELFNAWKHVEDKEVARHLRGVEGLGTEATRSDIVKKIIGIEYVQLVEANKVTDSKSKAKVLWPTAIGRSLIEFVDPVLRDPGFSASWEDALNRVESGELSLEDYMNWQVGIVKELVDRGWAIEPPKLAVEDQKERSEPCVCGGGMVIRRKSKKGNRPFWVCQSEDCGRFFDDDRGKPIMPAADALDSKCPACESELRIKGSKKKAGTRFWMCVNRDECGKLYRDDQGRPGEVIVFSENSTSTSSKSTNKSSGSRKRKGKSTARRKTGAKA